MTTRGMGVEEVKIIVDLIDQVILNHDNEEKIQLVKKQVNELCSSFPIYE
jgi:glycine hydroxymethyltransferase